MGLMVGRNMVGLYKAEKHHSSRDDSKVRYGDACGISLVVFLLSGISLIVLISFKTNCVFMHNNGPAHYMLLMLLVNFRSENDNLGEKLVIWTLAGLDLTLMANSGQ